jgi:NADH:ubiquinone oxidoreductase subunit 6 (subunit J)
MLIFMGGMGGIVLFTSSDTLGLGIAGSSPVDFRLIGTEMLTYYSPALVVIGLTLAGSIIGALALARREDINQKDERIS